MSAHPSSLDLVIQDGHIVADSLAADPHNTTAHFQLAVCQTGYHADELLLPCHVTDRHLTHTLLNHLDVTPGVRVTGTLQFPTTPAQPISLRVTAIDVLDAPPALDPATEKELATPAPPPRGLRLVPSSR